MATKRATKKVTKKATKRPAGKASAKAAAKRAKPQRVKKAAKKKASPVPKGYHTATPYLIVKGAERALAFYAKAFGAKQKVRMDAPDGSVMHAEMLFGDSMVMLSEENLEWGAKSAETLGGSPTHVMLYVKDVDAFVARAVTAGASVEMPIADMFWGDRYGKVRDPFGHVWSVATHTEDLTAKQMGKRMQEYFAQMASGN